MMVNVRLRTDRGSVSVNDSENDEEMVIGFM